MIATSYRTTENNNFEHSKFMWLSIDLFYLCVNYDYYYMSEEIYFNNY